MGDMQGLRLAVMPPEEFSAWSVGALAAGTPLAVSRAFRTEVQAMAFLATECTRRAARVEASSLPASTEGNAKERLAWARFYSQKLLVAYRSCAERAKDKLGRLRKWAQRQHGWTGQYADDAILRTTSETKLRGE